MSIHWEENTSEPELQDIVDSFQSLRKSDKKKLLKNFFKKYEDRLEKLVTALCESLDAMISEVIIVPIHGVAKTLDSVADAEKYIMHYDETSMAPILRYEIVVRYSNGKKFTMECADKAEAIQFLSQYTHGQR